MAVWHGRAVCFYLNKYFFNPPKNKNSQFCKVNAGFTSLAFYKENNFFFLATKKLKATIFFIGGKKIQKDRRQQKKGVQMTISPKDRAKAVRLLFRAYMNAVDSLPIDSWRIIAYNNLDKPIKESIYRLIALAEDAEKAESYALARQFNTLTI